MIDMRKMCQVGKKARPDKTKIGTNLNGNK